MSHEAKQLVIISDYGKDLDDENALLLAVGAMKFGEVDLRAVVANLSPAEQRARLAQGVLDEVGFSLPVGIGTDCKSNAEPQSYETNVPYISNTTEFQNGFELLRDTLLASEDKALILALNSGMTDAAELFAQEPALCMQKIGLVAIMGGVVVSKENIVRDSKGFMLPDDSVNNTFDTAASAYVYEWLQSNGMAMSIVSREAAYACQFEASFYQDLGQSAVAKAMESRQDDAQREMWRLVNLPLGHPDRGTLPGRCDREWFVSTYCNGTDPGDVEDIITTDNYSGKLTMYDPLNVAAALHPEMFDPIKVCINGVDHSVIGLSASQHGIKSADAIVEYVVAREKAALSQI